MATYTYEAVKKTVNRVDSWWSRLVLRHPGSWVLYLVANYTSWSPNFLSTLSFVFAIFTAVAFVSDYWLVGALLFQFSLIFDFIDGRMARLTKKASYFGEFLDNFYDQLKAVLLVVALFIGLINHYPEIATHWFAVGLILYLFLQELSVIIWLFVEKSVDKRKETHQKFADAAGSSWIGKTMIAVTRTFDQIGLRVIWSNIETNVILFSILPLMIGGAFWLLTLSNVMLLLFLIPESYVAIKIIRAKDQAKI